MTDDSTMENGDDLTAEEEANEVENHEQFITALELHGYSADPNAWGRIAKDLKWSQEEVKTYAYRYFNALQRQAESPPAEDVEEESSWTFEESILLEALLVRHLGIINEQNNNKEQGSLAWEELIAARIPGKTAHEVKQRYEEKYRQKGER
jgi:hypothetical protein